jgi:FMN phosphatase YigB (HAD superfamily)
LTHRGRPAGHDGPDDAADRGRAVRRRGDAGDARAAYAGRLATRSDAALADALYERILAPEGWRAYPDALPTLAALRARGIAIAAVSNVGRSGR